MEALYFAIEIAPREREMPLEIRRQQQNTSSFQLGVQQVYLRTHLPEQNSPGCAPVQPSDSMNDRCNPAASSAQGSREQVYIYGKSISFLTEMKGEPELHSYSYHSWQCTFTSFTYTRKWKWNPSIQISSVLVETGGAFLAFLMFYHPSKHARQLYRLHTCFVNWNKRKHLQSPGEFHSWLFLW